MTLSPQALSQAVHRASRRSAPAAEHVYGFDRELEYEDMVEDGIAMMRSRHPDRPGPLLAGFWCTGPDWESMDADQVKAFTMGLQGVLKTLDFGWMIHCEVIRRVEYRYRRAPFPQAIDAVIDGERARGGYYYVTDRALFLTRAPMAFDTGLGKRLKQALVGSSMLDTLDDHSANTARFERLVEEFGASLGRLMQVRRMRHHHENDELYQALKLCCSHVFQPCVLPEPADRLSTLLSEECAWTDHTMTHAGSHVTVVNVRSFPRRCGPLFLRQLSLLASDVRWSTRFIPLDHQRNEKMLTQLQRAWTQKVFPLVSKLFNIDGVADRNALDKTNQVAEAIREFNDRVVRYGLYTTTLVFRGRTQAQADEHAKAALEILAGQGFGARIEQDNKMAAYLGSLPGHGAQNARKTPMHTAHLACLLSLTEEYGGESTHPCPFYEPNSPPLMQVRNWSGGQYNLNLHAAGSTLGHTVLLGPTTHGKTFALAYLCSQFMKHSNEVGPAQVFFLDVGRSMLALTLARTDGAHYQLGGDAGLRLCPLAELDTVEDRAWASVWLQELFVEQGVLLDGETRARIEEAVWHLAECSSGPADRTLTHLLPHLLGSGLESSLSYYTSGAGSEVLNGDTVELERANFTTFELGPLQQYGKAIANPARAYIWRLIEKRCDGRPTLFVVDELFVALPEQRDAEKLKKTLNNIAKANCAVVLATQQLDQVSESPIANAVFESCATKILLPNPGMSDDMRKLYVKTLGLTAAQVDLLKIAEPKRWYMVLKDKHARLISFDAGPAAKAFFGARSQAELRVIAELVEKFGPEWPETWLRRRGLSEDADAFREHRRAALAGGVA